MKTLPELIRPAKTAVIVVDVQNDFCRAEGALGKAGQPTAAAMAMLPNLQALLNRRSRDGHARDLHPDDPRKCHRLRGLDVASRGRGRRLLPQRYLGRGVHRSCAAAGRTGRDQAPLQRVHQHASRLGLAHAQDRELDYDPAVSTNVCVRVDRTSGLHARLQHRVLVGLHGGILARRARHLALQHARAVSASSQHRATSSPPGTQRRH